MKRRRQGGEQVSQVVEQREEEEVEVGEKKVTGEMVGKRAAETGTLFRGQCTPFPSPTRTHGLAIPYAPSVLLCHGFQRTPPHRTPVEASVGYEPSTLSPHLRIPPKAHPHSHASLL